MMKYFLWIKYDASPQESIQETDSPSASLAYPPYVYQACTRHLDSLWILPHFGESICQSCIFT